METGRESRVGRGPVSSESMQVIRTLCAVRLGADELADVVGLDQETTAGILDQLKKRNLPIKSEMHDRAVRYWLDRREVAEWLVRVDPGVWVIGVREPGHKL